MYTQFKGKRVAILGLSVEGTDSAKFFSACEAKIICCDRRTPEQLGDIYTTLSNLPGITFQLGEAYLAGLLDYDIVVRTPGMALWLPELQPLREKKTLTSLTKLFFDLCPAPIIGVTGTKGKGTTSTLIYKMLQTDNKQTYLGGNVGKPLLTSLNAITVNDLIVLELSSFQLEDLEKSPHIAVVLKITQEHLANFDPHATNYHRSREEYIQAKEAIVRYQTTKDFALLNKDDETSSSFAHLTHAKKLYFSRIAVCDAYVKDHAVFLRTDESEQLICRQQDIKLRGLHNLENIAAASLAAHYCGVSLLAIQKTAHDFAGLEHRLELVTTIDNADYYNDSFSTIPETAIAALESFKEPVILIVGGSDKGSDYAKLGEKIVDANIKALIAIGAMGPKIIEAVETAAQRVQAQISFPIVRNLPDMRSVVEMAHNYATDGDVVLLSPACASFGMFKNYKERGQLFKHYVTQLQKNTSA